MIALSANLGLLWSELPLPDAVRAAKRAGFDAVECHWPYETDPADLKAALDETGLPMVALNTRRGPCDGDMGLAAQPGRSDEARAAIDEAFAYGRRVGTRAVHVMGGTRAGRDAADCAAVFAETLGHACDRAAETGMTVLVEPLNPRDAPDYVLPDLATARDLLGRVGRPELRIMFDCYHLQITGGDLLRRFIDVRDLVGHVQFAGVPDRGPPDRGEVAYDRLLPDMARAGWTGPFGAEYRPGGETAATLGWMAALRGGGPAPR